ncbi:MAG: SH3 domain-containing protein [Chloroflexota bacterium]|nr:SH3 domain-containing protein [Chloroflexota bacterium]
MSKRFSFPLFALCLGALIAAMWVASAPPLSHVRAQDAPTPAVMCAVPLNALWIGATDACIGEPDGYLCNGGAPPAVQPSGVVANTLAPVGALVEIGAVDALRAPPYSENGIGGILWLRRAAPNALSMVIIGDVTLQDATPPDLPAWNALILYTEPTPSPCADAPANVLILQSPLNGSARVAINGVSFLVSGTALVRTTATETIFASLTGLAAALTFGQEQPLWAGQQVVVPYNPGDYSAPIGNASVAVPLERAALRNLPVSLFDRPLILPQPGTVTTLGQVNLRTEPNTNAAVLAEVAGGEILAVLGASTDGAWFHVRRQTGANGWMLGELLGRNLGEITARYFLTPLPPQRLGDLGTQARVIASGSVNVRTGPDPLFPPLGTLASGSVVTLIARSSYSPWVKIDVGGGITGWVALIALDTRSYIDALPVDANIPPVPTITPLPGSFGNAFPDPNNAGN